MSIAFAKHHRLTYWSYDIICRQRLVTGDIFYFVISLIECRPDEIGHSCINNSELLGCSLLYVQTPGNERAHLSDNGASELEMQASVRDVVSDVAHKC